MTSSKTTPSEFTERQAAPAELGTENSAISRKLKELYQSVQDEGIPDRFLDLLDRLDAAEREAAGEVPMVDRK